MFAVRSPLSSTAKLESPSSTHTVRTPSTVCHLTTFVLLSAAAYACPSIVNNVHANVERK
eukprot:11709783-Ditylum_brightwellii.AAC.1